jgi:hypothetical protein
MAATHMRLRNKSGRAYTRNWNAAHYVKRATNKRIRRMEKQAIRDNTGIIQQAISHGWVW